MRRPGRVGQATCLHGLVLAAVLSVSGHPAQGWEAKTVSTPGPVREIAQVPGGAALRIGARWFEASRCPKGICLRPGPAPNRPAPLAGGLPDGRQAGASGPGVVRAWYAEPTARYGHGILGDRVEAGALCAVDGSGAGDCLRLPESQVFEDLTPRIADIDGDGSNDVVTIRSDLDAGAAIAIYRLTPSGLSELAATSPIGRANRWLNVAAIADLDGDRRREIAVVKTPHIGGTLEIWTFRRDGLVRLAARPGYSNHAIGSRNLDLSAVLDANGDGRQEVALPDSRRQAIEVVQLDGGRIETLGRIPVPGMVVHNMAAVGTTILVGLDSGALLAVSR